MNERSENKLQESSGPDPQSIMLVSSILRLSEQTQTIHNLYQMLYDDYSNRVEESRTLDSFLKCLSCDWQISGTCSNKHCASFPQKLPKEKSDVDSDINNMCVVNHKKKFFKCVLCTKIYKSKENLNLHRLNIHMNHKPYKCSMCSRRFSHRNGKLYHEKNFHS